MAGAGARERRWLTLLGGLGLLLLAAWAMRDRIAFAFFERAVDRAAGRNALAGLDDDAIYIAFCGTGSPVPSRDRGEACTAVIAGGRLYLFDAGEGAARTMAQMGLPLARLEGVWLTHLHSDHFQGLGNLALQRWAGTSAAAPLAVYGPQGTPEVTTALSQAYRLDSNYRIAHHGTAAVPPSGFGLAGRAIDTGLVHDRDGVRITAFAVDHRPVAPAYGYRIEWRGRSVTISGDTAPTPALVAAARRTDLLIAEAISPPMVRRISSAAARAGSPGRAKIMNDILNYHASPAAVADMAKAAGAKALILTHLVPSVPRAMEGAFLGDAKARFAGPVRIAHDGDFVRIDKAGTGPSTSLFD